MGSNLSWNSVKKSKVLNSTKLIEVDLYYIKSINWHCSKGVCAVRTGGKHVTTIAKKKFTTAIKKPELTITVSSARRALDIFFKEFVDHTVILPIGTTDHDQAIFIKKDSIPGLDTWRQFVVKVYNSNEHDAVLLTPTRKLIIGLSLTSSNMNQLTYNHASHRMTNKRRDCAVLMWLECFIVFKYGRSPFIRTNLECSAALKASTSSLCW